MHRTNYQIAIMSIAATLIFVLACSSNRRAETPTARSLPEARIVKGGSPSTSELARLMRDMTAFADTTGKRLRGGGELPPFPEQFKKLKTAEPTPSMVDRRIFDPYAEAWLHQLDLLYTASKSDRTEVFNDMIMACSGCHGQMCPGPLVRIKKLNITEGGE